MESISLELREILYDSLSQIRQAIINLQQWNEGIDSLNDLMKTPSGMQNMAGNCMVIMAIAEGFKKIDKVTNGLLLIDRPEIPWHQVFGLRNRIAHGYFDIDVEMIEEVIKNDLAPLLDATDYFLQKIQVQ